MSIGPLSLLRPGALDGRRVVLAPAAAPLEASLSSLGAEVTALPGDPDAAVTAAAALGVARALVVDVRPLLDAARAAARGDDALALRAALDGTWTLVHAVATAALIPAGVGTIVLVAPAPGTFVHAPAVRAGLENLARTLSTEWARHGVTTVALLPGDATPPEVVDALCAYVASPGGDYFSGCALELDALVGSIPNA